MMHDAERNNIEEQMLIQKAIDESKKGSTEVNPDVMSYEELLELSEKLGTVNKGFRQEEINMIPTVRVYCVDDEDGGKRK